MKHNVFLFYIYFIFRNRKSKRNFLFISSMLLVSLNNYVFSIKKEFYVFVYSIYLYNIYRMKII